jgi:glycerol uptake facilitator-like aquaporin
MSTQPPQAHRRALHPAVYEFALTTVLLFLAVTVVRFVRDPDSVVYVADLGAALVVIALVSGAILTGLILSPLGRRSGGHMNPAVTVALWLMDSFPGRNVAPYVAAQIAGSAAGTGLARLVWGPEAALPSVAYGAIRPAPSWEPAAVFLAEVGGMAAVILVVGVVLALPRYLFLMAYAIGLSVAVVIATMGTRSGGSINPARQFGPAVLSGQTTDLAIYLVAPILGAVLGAAVYRLARRHCRQVVTSLQSLTHSR